VLVNIPGHDIQAIRTITRKSGPASKTIGIRFGGRKEARKSCPLQETTIPMVNLSYFGSRFFLIHNTELFWVDLKLSNPLDVDVTLTNLSLVVQDADLNSTADFVEVENIKEVLLRGKESTIIPISLKSTRPAKLGVTHAVYDFLSLMPTKESLACRGRRLHDTLLQRQIPAYSPDTFMNVEVLPSDHRLTVKFGNSEDLKLLQGENHSLQISLLNSGSNPVGEIWMIANAEDDVWVGAGDGSFDCESLL
jgi:hypothetical protein